MVKRTGNDIIKTSGVNIIIGFLVTIIISIIGAIITTSFVSNAKIDTSAMKLVSHIIQFLASAFGGGVVVALAKEKRAIFAGIAVILYTFLLVSASILLMDSAFTSFWTSVLSIVLGYVVSCAFCITTERKRGKRKRIHR